MDVLHSLTLFLSLACGIVAIAAALWGRFRAAPASSARRIVTPAAVVAWVALLGSFSMHLGWGHKPGSPQALSPLDFLREHESFLIAALLPGVSLALKRWSARPD